MTAVTTSTEEIDVFLRECFRNHLPFFPLLSPAAPGAGAGTAHLAHPPQAPLPEQNIHVTLTYAQSLDAKIAGKSGKQLILSGKDSMAMTHRSAFSCEQVLEVNTDTRVLLSSFCERADSELYTVLFWSE